MKKNIAIVAGGDSSEVVVSLKSAEGIYSFIDQTKYNAYIVTIVGQSWEVQLTKDTKTTVDKNDFSFKKLGEKITFDFAYITIHGTPGENGLLQGYFDLIGLKYSTSGVLSSALTFNKFVCNNYLKGFGIKVADSILLRKGQSTESETVEKTIGFPCFIKPNVGGSSFGITKVKNRDEVQPAIEKAFEEGEEVLIEKQIVGNEFTCGMYKTTDKTVVFPITEIISDNEFFDYAAKYNQESQEITPARISDALAERISLLTTSIYDILDCKGIIRADYIVSAEGAISLLEVNITPGMTKTSFIPQQIAAAKLEITAIMTEIIEN